MSEREGPSDEPRPDHGGRNPSVGKNIAWLLVSQPITWVLSGIAIAVIPKYLGPESLGKLGIATAVWTVVGAAMGFGSGKLLTRDTARDPSGSGPQLGRVFAIETVVFLVAALCVGIYVQVQDLDTETAAAVAVIGLGTLVAGWSTSQRAVLHGRERMAVTSLSDIAVRLFSGIVLVAAVVFDLGIVGVAAGTTVVAFAHLLLFSLALRRDDTFELSLPRSGHLGVMKAAAPFFWLQMAVVLYRQIDVVVIATLVDEVAVGWYAAGDRLFGTMLFLPGVVGQAMFPNLARRYITEPEAMTRDTRRSVVTIAVLIMPVSAGVLVLAPDIVDLLMGDDFHGTAPVLAVYAAVIVPVAMTAVFGQYALAVGRQRLWTVVIVVSALATVPLDLVLVPWTRDSFDNGAIAGALAYAVTETGAVVVGGLVLLPGTFARGPFGRLCRGLAAAALMGGVVYALSDLFLLVPIIAGAVSYPVFAFLLRVLDEEEMATLRRVTNRFTRSRRAAAERNGGDSDESS